MSDRKRKRRWDDDGTDVAKVPRGGGDKSAAEKKKEELARKMAEMRRKKEEMKRKLEEKKRAAQAAQAAAPKKNVMRVGNMYLDEHGREVDAAGNLIKANLGRVATLKVNKRAQFEKVVEAAVAEDDADAAASAYYDERLVDKKPVSRRRRQFQFVEPGEKVREARRLREDIEYARRREAYEARKAAEDAEKQARAAGQRKETAAKEVRATDVPAVEWWDVALLPTGSYSDVPAGDGPFALRKGKVGNLVEHPVPIESSCTPKSVPAIPMYLTRTEKRKMRTKRRKERERERQEQVRLGLVPPPPPKVKLSNLMRVLGNEAIKDPTKIEAQVRRQVEARRQKHEKMNADRKLTPEQRRAKQQRKWEADLSTGAHVAVFRVDRMDHPQHLFKVEMNAAQYNVTGCAVLHAKQCLVVVEGGAKSLRAYKRLMTVRIDWDKKWNGPRMGDKRGTGADGEGEGAAAGAAGTAGGEEAGVAAANDGPNSCALVWEGVVKSKGFKKFSLFRADDDLDARHFLRRFRAEQYWDMVQHKPADE